MLKDKFVTADVLSQDKNSPQNGQLAQRVREEQFVRYHLDQQADAMEFTCLGHGATRGMECHGRNKEKCWVEPCGRLIIALLTQCRQQVMILHRSVPDETPGWQPIYPRISRQERG